MLTAQSASLIYNDHGKDVYACRDIDLRVGENEFLGILGPSGSGKSSLLYLLSGLKTPTRGQITFLGRDLAKLRDEGRSKLRLREFGFVFQQPYLLGYLTARENVLVAAGTKDIGLEENPEEQTAELLDLLGLGHKMHRMPHELSGGERQRVCVARALLGNPKVIFTDEPTAALDHTNGIQVVHLLNRHRGNGSLVMVTHDETMLDQADRIVRLVDGSLIGDIDPVRS